MKVYMKCRTKPEYDWFVNKYVRRYYGTYSWEGLQERQESEEMEMCSENGDIGWNSANGWLRRNGYKQVFMSFDIYLKELER